MSNLFLIIGLILFLVYVFHIDNYLGSGNYSTNDDYEVIYTEGTGGIHANLNLRHENGNGYLVYLTLSTITEGDVEDIGIINLSYSVYINTDHFADQDDSLSIPARLYDDAFLMYLYRNDRIICTGFVDAIFEVEGITQNETINFEISYILPINILSYSYEIHFPLVWLEIILFILIFVFLYTSFKIVKSILHEIRYVDDIKEKDTNFFTYMKKRNNSPRK